MRSASLIAFVLLFAAGVSAPSDRIIAVTADCDGLKPGETDSRETKIFTKENSFQAQGFVELIRPATGNCKIRYRIAISRASGPFTVVYTASEAGENGLGPAWVELIGLSPDGSKFGVDLGWSGGDYDRHRPTIYSLKTAKVVSRALGNQITNRLPSCDYFQIFVGITNKSEAIIHVPKSIYVDEGCPDQGDWVFNLVDGSVRRGSKAPRR
jgi:hypothetical protein